MHDSQGEARRSGRTLTASASCGLENALMSCRKRADGLGWVGLGAALTPKHMLGWVLGKRVIEPDVDMGVCHQVQG